MVKNKNSNFTEHEKSMKNFLKTALIILILNNNFANSQNIVKDSDLTNNKGLYYQKSNLFTGFIITANESTGCILSKCEVLNGHASGLKIEYYETAGYNSKNYLDTLLLIELVNSLKSSSDKKTTAELENRSLKTDLENFSNTRIKNTKKFEKIKINGAEGKLKGKDLILYNDYNELVKKIQLSEKLLITYSDEIQEFENKIKIEKAKTAYKPNISQEFFVIDNIKEGRCQKYAIDGQKIAEGNYKNGKQIGDWSFYFKNGKLSAKGSYINGDGSNLNVDGIPMNGMDGNWLFYNEDGSLLEQDFMKNGKLNGLCIVYKNNGNLFEETTYLEGKKNGIAKEFYPSGKLKREFYHKNGSVEGRYKTFYENGNMCDDFITKNGKKEGPYKEFYENGKLKTESIHTSGFRPLKSYYESGKLAFQGNIDTTSQNSYSMFGDVTMYNEDGTILYIMFLNKDGSMIDKKPKASINLSKAELNKVYRCTCCKSTINGIYDGVGEKGYSADKLTVESLYEFYSGSNLAKASFSNSYEFIRNSFEFCTVKCSRVCY